MFDSWIHGSSNPVCSDVGEYICPIAAFFANGECGAAAPAVLVPAFGAKATYPTGGPAALVRHVEAVVGVARCSVLCPAQDRNDLAEKAI